MNKKYIFIGLGLAVVAGVGIMIYKSKKGDKQIASTTPAVPKKLLLSKIKTATAQKMVAPVENKVSFAEEEVVVTEVAPIQMVPNREWLERSWKNVS